MKQYSMRRKDRAMAEADCLRLLETERVGRLAMCDQQGQPYLVPLNHVLVDGTIYFHCATTGRKLDLLQQNPKVCYEVDRMLGIKSAPSACEYGAFYESAIAFGTAFLVSDIAEKVRILNQLTAHHAAEGAEFAPVNETAAERVVVVGIRIDQLTGKARQRDQ
ncbi:MAG: pyridoxamine 5'-phosphate oxidase family protein [Bacillota bacterium]|jgi:nitroimidazol reductase NimA-like FMN-containing flavoprotein (pyridoxamine 5'-phosphate oxidase superfamily)